MGRRHRTRPSRYAGRKKEDYSVEEGCLVALFVKIPLALCFAMFTAKNPEDRMLAGGGLAIFIGAFLLAWMGVSSKVLYGIVIWAIVALLLFVFTAKKKNPSKDRLSNEEKPVSLPRQNSVPKVRSQAMAAKVAKEAWFESMPSEVPKVTEKVMTQPTSAEEIPCPETKEQQIVLVEPRVDDGKYYVSIEKACQINHVAGNYRRIMIEELKMSDIKECPAIAWVENNQLNVLPMLIDAQIISWPLAQLFFIAYEKRLVIDTDHHYQDMNTAQIGQAFEAELPVYELAGDGVSTGLFSLSVGLSVTNTSGKALAELLNLPFRVQDDVMRFPGYVKEVKEIYQNRILCDNGILTFSQYEQERKRLLDAYQRREKDAQRYQEQLACMKKLEL